MLSFVLVLEDLLRLTGLDFVYSTEPTHSPYCFARLDLLIDPISYRELCERALTLQPQE
jgi:hypothetical protein